MRLTALVSTVPVLGLCLLAATARAAWPPDGALLAPAGGAAIAADGRGGVYGFALEPDWFFTRAYRLGADGDTVAGWPSTGLELTPGMQIVEHNSITPVAAIPDERGGAYVLAYEQTPYTGHGGALEPLHLYLHRRDSDGRPAPGWDVRGVPLESRQLNRRAMLRRLPEMVSDGRGGALVAWLGVAEYGWPHPQVVVQRVTPAGVAAWGPDGVEIPHGPGACTLPALAGDGRGGALVFWGQWDSSGTAIRIVGQHLAPDGSPMLERGGRTVSAGRFDRMSGAVPFDGGWTWAFYPPAIIASPDGLGGAIACWNGAGGSDLDLHAARLDARGRLPWGRDVRVCGAPGEQASLVALESREGGLLVAWRDGRRGDDVGVFVQRVGSDGRAHWGADGLEVFSGDGDRGAPALAADDRAGAYVAWSEPTGGGRILAQHVLAGGRLDPRWPAEGAVVSHEAQSTRDVGVSVAMVEAGRGDAIVAWSDEAARTFAMKLTPGGPADSARTCWRPPRGRHPGRHDGFGDPGVVPGGLRITPNPVRAAATFRFDLQGLEPATLELLDLGGRRVWSREVQPHAPGEQVVPLSGAERLPTGVYFVRLRQGPSQSFARLVIVR